MSEQVELLKIAKDLTTAAFNSSQFEADDLKTRKSSDQIIQLFQKILAAVRKEAGEVT